MSSCEKLWYLEDESLADAVSKINTLRSWINKVMPEVLEVLRNAKFNKDGHLYKRDNEKMQAILETTPFRAFIRHMVYSKYLATDITATIKRKDPHLSDLAKYLKEEILVMSQGKVVDNFEPLLMFDLETVKADIAESMRLFEVAEKACEACRKAQYKVGHFTKL